MKTALLSVLLVLVIVSALALYNFNSVVKAQENNKFSFLFTGDDNAASAQRAIEYAYTTYPDLEIMFSIPDLSGANATYQRYRNQWLNKPGVDQSYTPIFFGLGNHDIEQPDVVDFRVNYLGPLIKSSLPQMTNFREGPYVTYTEHGNYEDRNLTYSFDYKNSHFIVLNIYSHDLFTGRDRLSGSYSPLGCAYQEILTWLETDLSNTNAKHKFVFYHEGAQPVPGGRHTGDSLDATACPDNYNATSGTRPMRDQFWSILAKYDVSATFVGHAHHNTITWANDTYGGFGALYEVEPGIPPNHAVVNINGDNAVLQMYRSQMQGPNRIYSQPFGHITISEDVENHAPKIYRHSGGNEAGFPIMEEDSINFEVGQSMVLAYGVRSAYGLYFESKDSDVEDKLTYSFNNLPSFLTVTEYDKLRRIVILSNTADSSNRFTNAEIGNYNFDVIVSDGLAQDTKNIDLTIHPESIPIVLGASIPNGSTINFPMHRGQIYFYCYDDINAAPPRYNGYSVKYNGADVSCCSQWHSYGTLKLTDKLGWSQFLFPDDYDGIKDLQEVKKVDEHISDNEWKVIGFNKKIDKKVSGVESTMITVRNTLPSLWERGLKDKDPEIGQQLAEKLNKSKRELSQLKRMLKQLYKLEEKAVSLPKKNWFRRVTGF